MNIYLYLLVSVPIFPFKSGEFGEIKDEFISAFNQIEVDVKYDLFNTKNPTKSDLKRLFFRSDILHTAHIYVTK